MQRHSWQRVSPEQAAAHPLYGLHGWLRVMSVLMALTAFAGPLISLVFAFRVASLPASMLPAGLVVVALVLLGTGIWVVGALLWFRLSPRFLRAWVELSGLSMALDLSGELLLRRWGPLPAEFGVQTGSILGELAVSLVLAALPYYLMSRSRRFRVTFQHELRDDDPRVS